MFLWYGSGTCTLEFEFIWYTHQRKFEWQARYIFNVFKKNDHIITWNRNDTISISEIMCSHNVETEPGAFPWGICLNLSGVRGSSKIYSLLPSSINSEIKWKQRYAVSKRDSQICKTWLWLDFYKERNASSGGGGSSYWWQKKERHRVKCWQCPSVPNPEEKKLLVLKASRLPVF